MMREENNPFRYRIGTRSDGRAIMLGYDGRPETEKTITVHDPRRPGGFMNIPSIYKGERVDHQDAFSRIVDNNFMDPDTNREIVGYGSLEEAVEAAKQRSQELSNDPGMLSIQDRLKFFANSGEAYLRPRDERTYTTKFDDVTIPQAIKDGFYLDNEIAAIMKIANKPSFPEQPDYDFFADPLVKENEDVIPFAIHSRSPEETAYIIKEFREEQVIRNRSGDQFIGRLIGGFGPVDLASLLAPIPFLSGARHSNRLKRIMAGGAGMALVSAPKDILLEATQHDRPIAETAVGIGAAFAIGGIMGGFTKRMPLETPGPRYNPEDIADAGAQRQSVGAMGLRADTDIQQEMWQEALLETGTKLERSNFNPMLRLLKSRFNNARFVLSDMVPLGGMKQNKIRQGEATSLSVETEFAVDYQHSLANLMRGLDEHYIAYRQARAAQEVSESSDAARAMQIGAMQGKDFYNKVKKGILRQRADAYGRSIIDATPPQFISHGEFRDAVGKAMRRNDSAEELPIPDSVKPHVEAAARQHRAHFDKLKQQAHEMGLFERPIQNQRASLIRRKQELQGRAAATGVEDFEALSVIEAQLGAVERQLANLEAFGPTVNTAPSYLTRMWRHDEIVDRYDELHGIIAGWLRTQGEGIEAVDDMATEIIEQGLLRNKPYSRYTEDDVFDDFVDDVGMAKQRTLEIPDHLVEDFLESDIEAITRFYTNSIGMDVLLARKFGDPSMKRTIDLVKEEAAEQTARATTRAERKKIADDLKRDLTDIRGLRDKLRGTYGLPNDPYRPLSRALRIGKIWNVLTLGGGFTLSAIPDMGRVVMTEGLKNSVGYGLKQMFNGQGRAVLSLMKEELQLSGTALDMVLGTRALQFADISDVYGKKFKFERGLMRAQGAFFIVNAMHMWNTGMKQFAGTVAGLRIVDDCMNWSTISQASREKLLRHGIDENMAERIAFQVREHGEQINGTWVPNTELWQLGSRADTNAMRHYRAALNQDADRTIITPNVGDRALWTSTEFGSVIAQFKSFGQSALPKLLISGLQERDAAFFTGLTLLVAMGHLTNEIKRQQYGDTRERSFHENLVEAIDRSGALGVLMDINNTTEKLSNYQLGLKPMLGMAPPYDASFKSKFGALFGPTGTQLANASEIISDVLSGDVDHWTKKRARLLVPGQNLPFLDPVADRMF